MSFLVQVFLRTDTSENERSLMVLWIWHANLPGIFNLFPHPSALIKSEEERKRKKGEKEREEERKEDGRKPVDLGQHEGLAAEVRRAAWTSLARCPCRRSASSVPALKISSSVLLNYRIVSEVPETNTCPNNPIFISSCSWLFEKRTASHPSLNQSYSSFSILPQSFLSIFNTYFC